MNKTWNNYEVISSSSGGFIERDKLFLEHQREYTKRFGAEIIRKVDNDEIKFSATQHKDHTYMMGEAIKVFHEVLKLREPVYHFDTGRVFDISGMHYDTVKKFVEVLIDPQTYVNNILSQEYQEIGYSKEDAGYYYCHYHIKKYYLENYDKWEKELYHCVYRNMIRLAKKYNLNNKLFKGEVDGKKINLTFDNSYPWAFGIHDTYKHTNYYQVDRLWYDGKVIFDKDIFIAEFKPTKNNVLLKDIETNLIKRAITHSKKQKVAQGQLSFAI